MIVELMTIMAGGDTLELRPSGEGNIAELYYRNMASQHSKIGDYPMQIQLPEGVIVTLVAKIQFESGSDREMLIVSFPNGDLVAIPEVIAVKDGEETVVQILRPMY